MNRLREVIVKEKKNFRRFYWEVNSWENRKEFYWKFLNVVEGNFWVYFKNIKFYKLRKIKIHAGGGKLAV